MVRTSHKCYCWHWDSFSSALPPTRLWESLEHKLFIEPASAAVSVSTKICEPKSSLYYNKFQY